MKNSLKILAIMFIMSGLTFIKTSAQIGTTLNDLKSYGNQKQLSKVDNNMIRVTTTPKNSKINQSIPGNIDVNSLIFARNNVNMVGVLNLNMSLPNSPIYGVVVIVRIINLLSTQLNKINTLSNPVILQTNHLRTI